jgi:hypothetical protein
MVSESTASTSSERVFFACSGGDDESVLQPERSRPVHRRAAVRMRVAVEAETGSRSIVVGA